MVNWSIKIAGRLPPSDIQIVKCLVEAINFKLIPTLPLTYRLQNHDGPAYVFHSIKRIYFEWGDTDTPDPFLCHESFPEGKKKAR